MKATVAEYLDGWLERQRHRLKPSTAGGHENVVRSWTVPNIGTLRLADFG